MATTRFSAFPADTLVKLSLVLITAAMALLAVSPDWWYGFVGCAVVASALLVRLWVRDSVSLSEVLALAILFRLFFFGLPPILSDDAYRYVWDGLLQASGINPYDYVPGDEALSDFHDEPIYSELNSPEFFSVYPPISQLIFWIGGLVYDFGWMYSYYVIKGLFTLMEMAGVVLLTQLVSARMSMLYALNPLTLVEVAGQAHTEAAMVFFLILTIWCVHAGYARIASCALAGAGMVKLYPFVLFPLLWSRFGWRAVWPGAGVALVVAAPYLSMDFFRNIADSLELYVQLFEFNAGLYFAVKHTLWDLTGADWSKQIGPTFAVLFFLVLFLIYWIDYKRSWSFEKTAIWITGSFFVLSTTVHPWYLLGIIPLAVLFERPSWHWLWIGMCSIGTYLFYVDGPYWTVVALGWGGGALLAGWIYAPNIWQKMLRRRARSKYERIAPYIHSARGCESPFSVLDLGGGEGYVGEQIRSHTQADVVLVDVVDRNQTDLPFVQYDGRLLPFNDDDFDTTVLYFVLHHCENPEAVLREAIRVTEERLVIVESVRRGPWQESMLTAVDYAANRLRSASWSEPISIEYRSADEWRQLLANNPTVSLRADKRFGNWLHPQQVLVADVQ